MAGVLVFCEVKDGKLKKTSREALAVGGRIAGSTGGDLLAFAGEAGVAAEAGKHGAKKLYVAAAGPYLTETYTGALAQVVNDTQPAVILLPGTSNGRDLAPRLAARLGAGVASDVDRLEWVDGKLRARRPVYSGKAFATVDVTGSPAIATTRPNAFPPVESGSAAA
ncbi:MAG TPA: electron transfer flavoprotein subunit alpha/FixB family protein, partial [Thermoanaerobaculia bacterium]|nr:electron transfer flavoprotein subunit alpha/FixB family protein [Thermoanaerobaculia bacterium]